MALKTRNSYGTITVSEDVIAMLAGSLALDSYGVVDMVPSKFSDSFSDLFRRNGKESTEYVCTRCIRTANKEA